MPEGMKGPRGGDFLAPFAARSARLSQQFEPFEERTLGLDMERGGVPAENVFKDPVTPEKIAEAKAALERQALMAKTSKPSYKQKKLALYKQARSVTLGAFEKYGVQEDEVPSEVVDILIDALTETRRRGWTLKPSVNAYKLRGVLEKKEEKAQWSEGDFLRAANEFYVRRSDSTKDEEAVERGRREIEAMNVLGDMKLAILETLRELTSEWKRDFAPKILFLDESAVAIAKVLGKDVRDSGDSNGGGTVNRLDESDVNVAVTRGNLHRFRTMIDVRQSLAPSLWQPAFLGPKLR